MISQNEVLVWVLVGECVSHNNPNEIKVNIGEKLNMMHVIVNGFKI